MSTFVCTDIHGYFVPWMKGLQKVGLSLDDGDKLIILGDLLDRGPDSLKCMQFALDLKQKYPENVVYLKGNHEQMFLVFLGIDPNEPNGKVNLDLTFRQWTNNGGLQALRSLLPDFAKYSVEEIQVLLRIEYELLILQLEALPLYHIEEDFAFVHAGFLSNTRLIEQEEDDMLWIREDFFTSFEAVKGDVLENKTIIHGHTPVVHIPGYRGKKEFVGKHHIGIDGGAAMGKEIFIFNTDSMKSQSVSVTSK